MIGLLCSSFRTLESNSMMTLLRTCQLSVRHHPNSHLARRPQEVAIVYFQHIFHRGKVLSSQARAQ